MSKAYDIHKVSDTEYHLLCDNDVELVLLGVYATRDEAIGQMKDEQWKDSQDRWLETAHIRVYA